MDKRKGLIIALHAIAITGIGTGYACLIMKNKKPKLNVNSLCSYK